MVVINDLFFENRFPSGWKLIPLIIYLPLGLVLATVRMFIGLQAIVAASLLQKLSAFRLFVLRTMCAILGIIVREEKVEVRDESVKVIVTNHVSLFDHIAVHLVSGSISVQVQELPSYFHFGFNYKNLGNTKESDEFIQNIRRFIDNGLVLDVQAENAITSGQKGLLRFSTWPCNLSHPVQPASIRIWRPPLMDIAPSVISSSWLADLFWFLFVPFSVFTVKYLPVIHPSENKSPEEMCKRIETEIGHDLRISPTNFTIADKAELEKRLETEKTPRKKTPSAHRPEGKLMEMAMKVKEVLPDVPVKTICAELAKNKNVDVTIANFLEGLVIYEPENLPPSKESQDPAPQKRKSSLEVASQPSTSFDQSIKTFPKSAKDRMISFQERKMKLIERARQRYIEKHALNVINSS